MEKKEFKQKYFTNNFYWVNKENYKRLQEIALEVGCLCHTGKAEIIEWHEGFKNLGFRTYEKNNNVTVFQKESFFCCYVCYWCLLLHTTIYYNNFTDIYV